MDPGRVAAAVVIGFIGLSCLAGFFRAFRERIYLALLGLAFIALAAEIVIPGPKLNWIRYSLLGLMGLLFVSAALIAVAQTMAQVRIIQERRKGLEREMWEYLEELKRRTGQTDEKPEEPPAGGGAAQAPETSERPASGEQP
jgi:hypothetical protein